MVDTVTTKYNLTKPEISGSPTTWGNKLNTNMDIIDGAMDQNRQAGVPVGSGAIWFTSTPPTNWLLCDGSSLLASDFPALFAIIGYTFGGSGTSFNLPPLATRFPLGAGGTRALAGTGGLETVTLDATMIPAHTHTATQPTHTHAATQPTHNHAASQAAHVHAISTGSHSHGVNDPTHTHTYATLGGGVNIQAGSGGNINATVNTGAAATGISIQAIGDLGGSTDSRQPAVTVVAASAGAITVASAQPVITVANAGGGLPHDNMPPWLGVNFIIKYQ